MKPVPIILSDSVASEPQRLIAESLRSAGWQVDTCSILKGSDYQALASRQGVARWRLRFLMYLAYPLKLVWRVLREPRFSIFIVSSNTFYAAGLAALVGRLRRSQVICLLYDLFPDALEVAGKIRSNGPFARLIGRFFCGTQRRCAGTVYIGEFLKHHAEHRWSPARRGCTIPVGTDLALFPKGEGEPLAMPVRIRYGGNFGYMHDPATVAACVRPFAQHDGLRFDFFISGVGYALLSEAFAGLPVTVSQPLQDANWRQELTQYPIGLASLSPGGATVCLPSKIYGMLAAGQAVVAICPAWSDLAGIVRDHDAGWIVNNSPYNTAEELEGPDYLQRSAAVRPVEEVVRDFSSIMEELLRNPSAVQQKRVSSRRAAAVLCSPKSGAQQWDAFLAGLFPASGRGGGGIC